MKSFDIPSFIAVNPSLKSDGFIKFSNKYNSFEYTVDKSNRKFNVNYYFDFGNINIVHANQFMSIKLTPYIHEDTKFNIAIENNGVMKLKSDLTQKVNFKSGVLSIQSRYSPYELAMAFAYTISGKDYTFTASYDKEINATLKYYRPHFSTDTKFSISDFKTSTFFKFNIFRVGINHGVEENGLIFGMAPEKVHTFLRLHPVVAIDAETKKKMITTQWSALCQYQVKPNLNLICKVNQDIKHPIVGFTTPSLKAFAQYDQTFKYSFELCI